MASHSSIRLKRRSLIVATSSVATVGLAGCLGGDDDTDDTVGDDPEDVVEAWVGASDNADFDAVQELLHPDGPELEEFEEMDEEEREETRDDFESVVITIDEMEVVEEDDEEAVVEVEMTFDFDEEEPMDEVSDDSTVELRTHDDDWQIWEER